MPYIQPEVLEELKRIDLYTYLKASDPGELVHVARLMTASKYLMGNGCGGAGGSGEEAHWII